MNTKTKQEEKQEAPKETALIVPEVNDLEKPQKDTQFAQASAKLLVDIIKKNNWSKKLGGQSEHIQYEGWQTAGKYYGYAVKTYDAEFVTLGSAKGFKAKAVVVNERTGVEVGGAEAYCMNDEPNWNTEPRIKEVNGYKKTIPGKPLFQLASMAQTRAGSKALRQNLGFVIALAGYNPTPAEEMEGVVIQSNQPTNYVDDSGVTHEPVAPKPQAQVSQETQTCQIHNKIMKKRMKKDGGFWFDHRWQDETQEWQSCNGKPKAQPKQEEEPEFDDSEIPDF